MAMSDYCWIVSLFRPRGLFLLLTTRATSPARPGTLVNCIKSNTLLHFLDQCPRTNQEDAARERKALPLLLLLTRLIAVLPKSNTYSSCVVQARPADWGAVQ